jgi:TolB protein
MNAKVIFMTGRDGNYEIYWMDADGSGPTNLTANPAADIFPSVSPNGGQVVFTTFRDGGNAEIYVMNTDGSGQTRLTNSAGVDSQPSWSPDGQRIAFRTDRDGDWEIYSMNADGSGQTRLTNSPGIDDAPAWSPDGGRIAFESDRDGDHEVYLMNADGSGPLNLTANAAADGEPSWSPDGQHLAFRTDRDGNDEIYSITPSGALPARLTTDPGTDSEPAWSPDGSKILFRSTRDGNSEVYVMGTGGAAQTRLTTVPQLDAHPEWQPWAPGYARPLGASLFKTSLVPAYQQCTEATSTHGPPLSFPSCSPPTPGSAYLTVGTSDANGLAANSVGSLRHAVQIGTPGPPDDSNDRITFSYTDVRCYVGIITCAGGGLSDYTGELEVTMDVRVTDKNNGPGPGTGGTDPATMIDTPLAFTAPCAATAGTAGGSCPLSTSMNVLLPGFILDGRRTVIQFSQIRVLDGGLDGQAETTPNGVFAVQGVFVP